MSDGDDVLSESDNALDNEQLAEMSKTLTSIADSWRVLGVECDDIVKLMMLTILNHFIEDHEMTLAMAIERAKSLLKHIGENIPEPRTVNTQCD